MTDTKRVNLTVKEESLPGESTKTLLQNVTKKRRRRKKKNITQNWEENEQSKDGKKAKECCDGARTGHEGDVEMRHKGNYVNNNAKPGGTLDEAKGDKRAYNDVTSRSVTRKGENPDASWTVKEVRKLVENAIDENAAHRDKKQRKVKSPRNVQNKASDTSDNSGAFGNNGTVPRETCHKAITKQSANVRERKEIKYQGDDKAGYKENCTGKKLSSDITKRQWNKANHDTNVPDHRRRCTTLRGSSFDRSSEKAPRETEHPENHRHCVTVDRARRRSIDRSLQKDPGERDSLENSTDTQTKRRSFICTSENDLRESELPESDRHPNDHRRRRRSFEHTSENDTNDNAHRENRRHPNDFRRRRRSFKHTSENDTNGNEQKGNHRHPIDNQRKQSPCRRASNDVLRENEHQENHRHYPSYNRTRRRSSHRNWEDDPRGSELVENQRRPIDNKGRRKSLDCSSSNDAERNELLEDNRYHPSDKQTRRKSYDRKVNNAEKGSEFLENKRRSSTANRTTSGEPEKLKDYEESKTENSVEPSTGMS